MLIRTTKQEDFEICKEKLSIQFPETWDYDDDLRNNNIHVLTNKDKTIFFILRIEDNLVHYDFGYVDKELRNQGLGNQALNEIVEYCKEFGFPIRATVRLENKPSYKTMINAGFIENETSVIGTSTGVEMFYYYPLKLEISKYKSEKPSSCGLTVLSALSELKYHNYIKPDDLNITCVENLGIPKETMIQAIMSIFNEHNFKVISNYTNTTEQVFHLFEQHFTKPNRFAIMCIKEELIWDHWILVTGKQDNLYFTFDNEKGINKITKQHLFFKAIQSNFFTILL